MRDMADQLAGLIEPQSIAIIGASTRTDRWSGSVIPAIRRHGFTGEIYPVNAKYEQVDGLPCYPSVSAIPGPVDAVLIFVPKHALPDILEDCGKKGVRGAVILASGFSEIGEDGQRIEEQLREIANRHRIAICGPNCLGLANLADNFIGLTAATFPEDLSPGKTALISQSGQLLMVLLARAHDQGVHFRYIVSTGNELNVDASDYASFALKNPKVSSVAMVLEGLHNPQRFLKLADEAQQIGKPLVVLKLGRSQRAARTALAHTGKMAGAFRIYASVFRQNNIVSVDDPFELADVASLFEKCPAPRGNRISVVSFSGGWCGVIADQAEALNIPMADFSPATVTKLAPLLDFTPPVNPLDLSGNVNNHPERWAASLDAVLEDENTDIMVVFIHQVRAAWRGHLISPLLELAKTSTKPIVVVYDGGKVVEEGYELLARDRSLPVYRGTQPMLQALKRFLDFHQRKDHPRAAPTSRKLDEEALKISSDLLRTQGRSLSEYAAKTALRAHGLPMVQEQLVYDESEALAAADSIEFPVVMKGIADGMEHKTEAGLVHLNLTNAQDVKVAFADLSSKLAGHVLDGLPAPCVVQRMVSGGVEAILGVQNDPDFGPMVLVGAGGVMTELLNDTTLRRAPLGLDDAREMIDETKLAQLLAGFRGAAPADRAALETAIVQLSEFALIHADEIDSIDLNPVLVLPQGQGCVAVDALIIKAGAKP